MYRTIEFKKVALQDPETYKAMLKDGVKEWLPNFGSVILRDELHADYPALREHFMKNKYSYDLHQQRANEGDHTRWTRGRDGKEIQTNISYEEAPFIDLRKLEK